MPLFERYIGIDYSGAQTADASLKGLQVYMADGCSAPARIAPPAGPKKYWTRRALADWLACRLRENVPTVAGIDHAFCFPLTYFAKYQLSGDWQAFLEDFHFHWPTDEPHTFVDFVRENNPRSGSSRWRRLAEIRSGSAKSVFHFDVPGSVAKSTHAGLPWLLHIRTQCAKRTHFWPFDGWEIPPGKSVVTEIYPSLWSKNFPAESRTPDEHDAYSVAAWLQRADAEGTLAACFQPPRSPKANAQWRTLKAGSWE